MKLMKHEKEAIGLYVVLDRDMCDFIDMVKEASTYCLETLSLMLSIPNPSHDKETKELNKIGFGIVDKELLHRAKQ